MEGTKTLISLIKECRYKHTLIIKNWQKNTGNKPNICCEKPKAFKKKNLE